MAALKRSVRLSRGILSSCGSNLPKFEPGFIPQSIQFRMTYVDYETQKRCPKGICQSPHRHESIHPMSWRTCRSSPSTEGHRNLGLEGSSMVHGLKVNRWWAPMNRLILILRGCPKQPTVLSFVSYVLVGLHCSVARPSCLSALILCWPELKL